MKFEYFLVAVFLFLYGCGGSSTSQKNLSKENVIQDDISGQNAIEYLSKKTYIFPALDPETRTATFQALERFDIIFVGHDQNPSSLEEGFFDLAISIPGTYTHILTYLGKDSEGFAYAIEMNTAEGENYTIGLDGLKVDGRIYIYCLGSDYGQKECPKDDHIYGLEKYDFMWAKQIAPELKDSLMAYEDEIIATIKNDLDTVFPFQLPMHIGVETKFTKVIPIIDDGRVNGADCTDYVMSLYEEIAGTCLDDVRLQASEITDYFINDEIGMQAVIPAKYNIFTEGDISFSEVLTTQGYSIIDNIPRKTLCLDQRTVTGFPTPAKVFNSPSMIPVQIVEPQS